MNRVRSFVVFAAAALCLGASSIAQPPQPLEKGIVAKGKRFAFIVGVGVATPPGVDLEPLPGCIKDAHALSKVLREAGYQTTTLTEEDPLPPTKANVVSSLQSVCAAAQDTDQILVYFSTHGGAPKGDPLLALKDDVITLKSIKSEVSKSKALVRIVMLDSCRVEKGFRTEASEFRDIHVVLSCRPDEKSTFGPSGLSAFTEVLVEALTDCKGDRYPDGRLDLDEVLNYLDDHVQERAEAYSHGHKQNPTRTVVDPRSLNPVMATCKAPATATESVPVAVRSPVRPKTRNDLIVPASLVGKIEIGMPAKQVLSAAGKAAAPFTLDQNGRGQAVLSGIPKAGDEVRVWFVDGLVTRVQELHEVPCLQLSDVAKARGAWEKMAASTPDKEVTKPFAGLGPERIFELFGCPAEPLRLDTDGGGEVSYRNVPRDQNLVKFTFTRGLVSHVSVSRVWACDTNPEPAVALINLARLSGGVPDDQLSAALSKATIKQIVDAIGCPPKGPLLIDETGAGSGVYPDFPKVGDLTTVNFRNSYVIGFLIDRAISCDSPFNAASARAGFAKLAGGGSDSAVNDALRAKTPEQMFEVLGCPSAPMRLDGNGMGYATYSDIPEVGDTLTVLFHKRSAIGAEIERRVK